MGVILAIDQGTTGTTCLIVDVQQGAKVLGRGYREFPQHFPRPGWVEHNLEEIWVSVEESASEALQDSGVPPSSVIAIGITNQRETTGVWSASGEPLHNALVWQDRRTAPQCSALRDAGHLEQVRARTGLLLDPYFSGTKVAWLLENVEGLREKASRGEARFGTMDTWLVGKLTQHRSFVTDITNASRTLLFNIHTCAWDEELAELLGGVPSCTLAEVLPSSGVFGTLRGFAPLPDGIPITGIAGDQQAALFGQACFRPGMAKCTYGTGAFALVNTGENPVNSESGVVTTIAWKLGDTVTYALEGSAFIAGAMVQWLRDGLQIIERSSDVEALAREVESSAGVVVVPALTGLGAPHWRPEARGVISGLTRGVGRAHIARATLEGIALQIGDLLSAMAQDMDAPLQNLRVDGGAAANNLLMQFQADILQVAIDRPKFIETTALGAAYLAALGAEAIDDLADIEKDWQLDRTFSPHMSQDEVDAYQDAWQRAVSMA